MVYKNLQEIILSAKTGDDRKRLVVACAEDSHTIEAVVKAKNDGLIIPILTGDAEKIEDIFAELGIDSEGIEIVDAKDNPIETAIRYIRENKADFMMKGTVQTADLLKAVLNKEDGLMEGKTLSHILFEELPGYHKIFAVTDSAIVTSPDLEKKTAILENAVKAMRNLGYENPKIAVLTAVENVNPKMQETVDAAELKKLAESGAFGECTIEGPISTDLAFDKEAGQIKGFTSSVCGDPDILLMPNVLAGNIAVKLLKVFGASKSAGIVLGAQVPIVLTSRSSSVESKNISIALGAAMSAVRR